MKTFWHINEARGADADMLTPMMLLSSQLTLWAPSRSVLDGAYQAGICPFNSDEFLELLKNGCFRIAAREDWLVNGDQRKSSKWEGAVFDREFDGEILKIFAQDHGQENARVFTVRDARGYDVADEQIEAKGSKYQKTLSYIRAGKAPSATLRRINQFVLNGQTGPWTEEMENKAAREIIRDAVNHEDARIYTSSNTAVEIDRNSTIAFADIVDRDSNQEISDVDFSIENVGQAIAFVKSLAGVETVDGIIDIKNDTKEQDFLWSLQVAERDHARMLATQISAGEDHSTIYEDIFGKKIEEKVTKALGAGLTVTSAIHSAKAKKVSRRSVIYGLVGMGIAAAPTVGSFLERGSIVPERDYAGPSWPFVLRYGEKDPNRQMTVDMLKFLDSI